jgi:hypothetical protein
LDAIAANSNGAHPMTIPRLHIGLLFLSALTFIAGAAFALWQGDWGVGLTVAGALVAARGW